MKYFEEEALLSSVTVKDEPLGEDICPSPTESLTSESSSSGDSSIYPRFDDNRLVGLFIGLFTVFFILTKIFFIFVRVKVQ